jgi:hypothetical protein
MSLYPQGGFTYEDVVWLAWRAADDGVEQVLSQVVRPERLPPDQGACRVCARAHDLHQRNKVASSCPGTCVSVCVSVCVCCERHARVVGAVVARYASCEQRLRAKAFVSEACIRARALSLITVHAACCNKDSSLCAGHVVALSSSALLRSRLTTRHSDMQCGAHSPPNNLCAQIGLITFNVGLTLGLARLGTVVGEMMPSAFHTMPTVPGSPFFGQDFGMLVSDPSTSHVSCVCVRV